MEKKLPVVDLVINDLISRLIVIGLRKEKNWKIY